MRKSEKGKKRKSKYWSISLFIFTGAVDIIKPDITTFFCHKNKDFN